MSFVIIPDRRLTVHEQWEKEVSSSFKFDALAELQVGQGKQIVTNLFVSLLKLDWWDDEGKPFKHIEV